MGSEELEEELGSDLAVEKVLILVGLRGVGSIEMGLSGFDDWDK